MSKILVVGSLGYDTILAPTGRADEVIGGSANYFSMAASLYSGVRVVGVVGDDYAPNDLKLLSSRNIDVRGIQVETGKTFRWAGSYVQDLNEAMTLKTELNVFRHFNPRLPDDYADSEYVFLANIDPVLQEGVLDQVKNAKLIGLDTMNYWIESKKSQLQSVIGKIDILFLNEKEALSLAGEKLIVPAIQKLHAMGPKVIVVKRGEYGFFMSSNGRRFALPALPLQNVIDPTGAGDTFAGGFFGYLAKSNATEDWGSLQSACVHGTVMASFAVQDFSVKALTELDASKVENRISEYLDVVSLVRPKSK